MRAQAHFRLNRREAYSEYRAGVRMAHHTYDFVVAMRKAIKRSTGQFTQQDGIQVAQIAANIVKPLMADALFADAYTRTLNTMINTGVQQILEHAKETGDKELARRAFDVLAGQGEAN